MTLVNRPPGVSDVINALTPDHGQAAGASDPIVPVGGVYVAQPTANASGDVVRHWVDARGYDQPHIDAVTISTITTAGSGTTGTGTLDGLSAFNHMTVVVDLSASAGAEGTLAVFVDSQLGGSGTWINLAQLTAITAVGKQLAQLTRHHGTNIEVAGSADAGAGTMRRIGWGTSIRIRQTVTGTATTAITSTVYIWAST